MTHLKGIKHPNFKTAQNAAITSLIDQGYTSVQVGHILGISYQRVQEVYQHISGMTVGQARQLTRLSQVAEYLEKAKVQRDIICKGCSTRFYAIPMRKFCHAECRETYHALRQTERKSYKLKYNHSTT